MENEVVAQKKLWTTSFVLIILVNFFVYVGNFMLMSTLPLHILNIGGNEIMAGLIVGIYSLTGFISRLRVGSLLDQKGRSPIMFAGLIILFLVNISYIAAAYSVIMLLMLRAIHGIGWSATTTSTSTIASDIIPAARRMDGMGFFGISISIAMVIGPGLGLYIMEHYSDMVLFSFSACFIVLALLVGFLKNYHYQCKEDIKIVITDKSTENTVGKNKKVVIERSVLWPSFLFFIIVMTYSTIMIFLPAYAKYKGVTDSSVFFIIMALAMIITRLVIGRIVDRYGMEKVVVGAMVLLAISLHLLFIATSFPMFLVAAVIYGLGYGAVQPALNALVISLAPVERRGAANATFLCAMDMGGILGAVVWGSVAQTFGFIYIYSTSTILIILSVILYLVAFRRKLNL
jgi:MFS family permease